MGYSGAMSASYRLAAPESAADLVLYNGTVLTMDRLGRRGEALAIRDGRVMLVGSSRDVLAFAGERTRVMDLRGRCALPGFIGTHNHPISVGARLRAAVDASTPPNASIADIVERVAAAVARTPPGVWIRGERYDDTLLKEMRHPNRWDLDRVAPHHPVYLTHVSGHLGAANSLALRIAGITRDLPDPPGGAIFRDADGEPTGVLAERAAQSLVAQHLPVMTRAEIVEALAAASDSYVAAGITSAHDTGLGISQGPQAISGFREAVRTGRFRPRVYAFLAEGLFPELADGRLSPVGAGLPGLGDDRFRLGAVKIIADGSIQGLTGALAEPYDCAPHTRGVLTQPGESLATKVRGLHDAGWHIGIHGNGDAGIQAILDAYAAALAANPRPDHRYRVEHCQMAREDQLDRMAELGVAASFFIKHVYYWGDRHRDIFIGPARAERISPLASAERRGIRFALHSDCPVSLVPPLEGIWAAVNRITRDGKLLGPEQRVSVETALRAYTSGAAALGFEEDRKGTLVPGKLGDVTVLAADPTRVDPMALRDLAVEMTVVGGEVVWARATTPTRD